MRFLAQRAALLLVLGASAGRLAGAQPLAAGRPLLLRADAWAAPHDGSLAHAFGFVVDGVMLDGVGSLWTPVPDDPRGRYSACTMARIGASTILTAAHCVTDLDTGVPFAAAGAFARFVGPGTTHATSIYHDFAVARVDVRPDWFGFYDARTDLAHDVAVVTLGATLPDWVTTYALFDGDALGAQALLVGHGAFGGGVGATGFDGRRRWGTNRIDFTLGGQLYADFDDGTAAWDATCLALGVCDTGLASEAAIGGGDSGGPLFIGGRLAGVASFGTAFCLDDACAVTFGADPSRPTDSFGTLSAWAPVADNLAFIRATSAPEPATSALVAGGLLAIGGLARRRARDRTLGA